MPEINLLPDELREKESRELKSTRKKSRLVEIEMSSPKKEIANPPLKTPKPSILSRLFAKKIVSNNPPYPAAEKVRIKPEEFYPQGAEKVLHIPKVRDSQADLAASDFAFENPAGQKMDEPDQVEESKYQAEDKFKKEEAFSPKVKTAVEITKSGEEKKKGSTFWSRIIFGRKNIKNKKEGEKVTSPKDKPMNERLDVNLIPEELARYPELELPKKLFASGMMLFIAVLLVIGAYLGIAWYQFKIIQEIKESEAEIISINEEISNYEKDKQAALELQQYLQVTRELLNNHVYWTKFFSSLEKYTLDEVYYNSFSMSGKDELAISAVGKDYNSVAKQLVALQQASDFIKSVKIDAASAEIDQKEGVYLGVSFNINLQFQPNVFLKPIE